MSHDRQILINASFDINDMLIFTAVLLLQMNMFENNVKYKRRRNSGKWPGSESNIEDTAGLGHLVVEVMETIYTNQIDIDTSVTSLCHRYDI